jgi:hypothetical protein
VPSLGRSCEPSRGRLRRLDEIATWLPDLANGLYEQEGDVLLAIWEPIWEAQCALWQLVFRDVGATPFAVLLVMHAAVASSVAIE